VAQDPGTSQVSVSSVVHSSFFAAVPLRSLARELVGSAAISGFGSGSTSPCSNCVAEEGAFYAEREKTDCAVAVKLWLARNELSSDRTSDRPSSHR